MCMYMKDLVIYLATKILYIDVSKTSRYVKICRRLKATLLLGKRGSINKDTLQIGSSVVNGTIIGKIFLIVSCTLR